MRNSIYSVTLDEALQAVGAHQCYQIRTLGICASIGLAVGFSIHSQRELGEVQWGVYLGALGTGGLLWTALEALMGRKGLLRGSSTLSLLANSISSVCNWTFGLSFASLLKGVGDSGCLLCVSLLIAELIDWKFRNWGLALFAVSLLAAFVAGEIMTGLFQPMRVVPSLASGLLALSEMIQCYVLESPRYLACIQGKYSSARTVLQRIAALNGQPLFNDMLQGEKVIGYRESPTSADFSGRDSGQPKLAFVPIGEGIVSVSEGDSHRGKLYCPWHLLSLQSMRITAGSSGLIWLAAGITLGTLTDNSEIWLRAADIGVVLGAALVAGCTSRLKLSVTLLVLSGLGCLMALGFTSKRCEHSDTCQLSNLLKQLLLMASRGLAHGQLFALWLLTLEQLPTVLRLAGLSVCFPLLLLSWSLFSVLSSSHSLLCVVLSGVVSLLVSVLGCSQTDPAAELADYTTEDLEEMKQPAELSQVEVKERSGREVGFQPLSEEKAEV